MEVTYKQMYKAFLHTEVNDLRSTVNFLEFCQKWEIDHEFATDDRHIIDVPEVVGRKLLMLASTPDTSHHYTLLKMIEAKYGEVDEKR